MGTSLAEEAGASDEAELDAGAHDAALHIPALQDGQTGHDLVPPPGEQAQHPHGVRLAPGLSENLPVHHNDGVGSDDDVLGCVLRGDGLSLFLADTGDLLLGRERGVHRFVDVCGMYGEVYAEQLQKLLPAGGPGCQNDCHVERFLLFHAS